MALSKDWTVQRFFEQATTEFVADRNSQIYVRRFELINLAVSSVVGLFYDILGNSYITEETIVSDTTGRYYTSGASWVASTKRLTATMNTSFAIGDIGKAVMFRIGTSVYFGTISDFVSTTVVEISGNNLPTSNGTVDYVLLSSTTPTNDKLPLSLLRIMKTSIIKVEILSTATKSVEAVSSSQLSRFLPDAPQKLKTIAWTYVGDDILLEKGDSLSSYGTITIRYPRVPIEVTADTDYVDVPDGAAIDICLLKLASIIARKSNKAIPDYDGKIASAVNTLMKNLGGEGQMETIKEKIASLV